MSLSQEVKIILEDIRKVKIQGARNIAKAVLNAIKLQAEKTKDKNQLIKDIAEIRNFLLSTRKTEPMAKNLIEVCTRHLMSYSFFAEKEDLEKFLTDVDKIISDLDNYYKKMLEYGAKIIEDGSMVITICHSSSVTGVLKKAKDMGKEIKVISSETRPLFQGRITSKELASYGIKVTHIIDSEVAVFIKKADIALVGADAIDAEGNLYNKVGSKMLAEMCMIYDVPFYSVAELLKFDPQTLFGYLEPIEYRDSYEIWENHPKEIEVINPAFDKVSSKFIKSYITEEGLILPNEIKKAFEKKYKELLKQH